MMTTTEFRISRSHLLCSALLMRHAAALWTALCVMLVAGVTLSFAADWRFGLVTAMLMLVLAPGVMALLYLNYALSPRCLPEVWPHTVAFGSDGFRVEAKVPPLPVAADGAEDGEDAPGPPEPEPEPATFGFSASYAEVAEVRAGLDGLVLRLAGSPPGLVHVPYSALEGTGLTAAFIQEKCGRR